MIRLGFERGTADGNGAETVRPECYSQSQPYPVYLPSIILNLHLNADLKLALLILKTEALDDFGCLACC